MMNPAAIVPLFVRPFIDPSESKATVGVLRTSVGGRRRPAAPRAPKLARPAGVAQLVDRLSGAPRTPLTAHQAPSPAPAARRPAGRLLLAAKLVTPYGATQRRDVVVLLKPPLRTGRQVCPRAPRAFLADASGRPRRVGRVGPR